jgi:hypothetical protein
VRVLRTSPRAARLARTRCARLKIQLPDFTGNFTAA